MFFLDASFAAQYEAEDRLIAVLGSFALLTILIACLGLAGLAAFSTAQRTREIGIRKTLGATSLQVVSLLSKDFLKPVVVAVLLAAASGWMISIRWLDGYAYRTEINGIQIGIAACIMLLIAITTVSLQSYRASRANPAVSVRYE
ncbi:MAG: FtsX-like permease family protein [Bacteroidetes bacterium]|nr:FtsX-like permease family protein [Bacteroidota bacterium]MDA0875376.1 FtsX-like permease family protein [Bacteroidota bacterium]